MAPLVQGTHALKIVDYYRRFGFLFQTLTANSRFLNLGIAEGIGTPHEVRHAQEQLVLKAARAGGLCSGMKVLDAGCGLGGPAALLAETYGCSVTAIDIGRYQMDSIRAWKNSRRGQIPFRMLGADTQLLPFKDHSFERVYSIESAFHFQDKPQFLRECYRVLKPSGKLVLADILMKGRSGSSVSTHMSTALSSPEFFTRTAYRKHAKREGFSEERIYDVSAGVMEALPLMRNAFFTNLGLLKKQYTVLSLMKMGFALAAVPHVARYLPFEYAVFVFCKK
jgi:ubiquinone/menaquinone biosynthesis C-methylase UbiE